MYFYPMFLILYTVTSHRNPKPDNNTKSVILNHAGVLSITPLIL